MKPTTSQLNKEGGRVYFSAMQAAETLAILLPVSPPKPALPWWPFSPRAIAWLRAMHDAADGTDITEVHAARDALSVALAWWERFEASLGGPHPHVVRELRGLMAHVLPSPSPRLTFDQMLSIAFEEEQLTPSQAAHWRYRIGLPDPETARAREAG